MLLRLYDRDYNTLTADEERKWKSLLRREVVGKIGNVARRTWPRRPIIVGRI